MNDNFVLVIFVVALLAFLSISLIFTTKEENNSFDKITVKGVITKIERGNRFYSHYYRVIDVSSRDSLLVETLIGTKSYFILSENKYDVNDTIIQVIEIPKIK